MKLPILAVRIQFEHDVVACRQRARQIAEAIGLERQQQTRLATAVSEIARNAFAYGGGGRAEFYIEGVTAPQLLFIRISDEGKGISNLEEILAGRYRSETGMGLGIVGARRLMDRFVIESFPGNGTAVTLGKLLPRRAPPVSPLTLPKLLDRIEREKPRDILDEFRDQNQELMRTLDELRKRQDELSALNRELEDTNRGVVALYAELDEKADHLRRADEVKSRFLSNMSHEFRTPLNSILALSRLLLDRVDGDLTKEQEVQTTYIRKSAESLSELVNDLLDLAKVEAGKIVIRPVEFEVKDLFGALRGMLRPLLLSSSLNLVFGDANNIPSVYSDEGKVSQILRNFISNALKFTESGEVRVTAEYDSDSAAVTFRVSDTGIGIAPEDQETIFQEFTQIDSPLQRRVKGTGLGLPLSRRLAELLGGRVSVESERGKGSVFSLHLPVAWHAVETPEAPEIPPENQSRQDSVLLVEDSYETRLLYERYLHGTPWKIVAARSVREAENVLRYLHPVAIVLDIVLQGEDTWDLLARLKSEPATSAIPILVATSVDDGAKALALGADAFAMKPVDRPGLIEKLNALTGRGSLRTVLLVDDEEISRYLARQLFGNPDRIRFVEAASGRQALEAARNETPALVVMDLTMPDLDGFQTIEQMRGDPYLKNVPIVVSTSRVLSNEESEYLSSRVAGVFSKRALAESGAAAALHSLLSAAGLEDLVTPR